MLTPPPDPNIFFPPTLSPELSNKTDFVSPGLPQSTFSNTFRKEYCMKGVINCETKHVNYQLKCKIKMPLGKQ